MYLDKARAAAAEVVEQQPAGFHDRLSDDPSFKSRLINDIAQAIIDAYYEGRQHQLDQA